MTVVVPHSVAAAPTTVKRGAGQADAFHMSSTGRLADDARLTVDEVATMTRHDRKDVLQAIGNRSPLARQERGDWIIYARDMRRWLSRL